MVPCAPRGCRARDRRPAAARRGLVVADVHDGRRVALRRHRRASQQGYAVRVEPHDGLLAPYDIDGQFRLHRAILDHSDVPMPDLYWLEHDTDVLGMPFFVMERAPRRRPRAMARQRPGDLPLGRGAPRDRPPVRRHRGAHPRRRLARGRSRPPGSGGLRSRRVRPLLGRPLGRATTRSRSSSSCRCCATQ